MNEVESDSQWKIYGANPMSLAIVSDYKKICNSISDARAINGSQIMYYNPEIHLTSSHVIHQPIMKRNSFEHEREFRLFYWDHSSIRAGFSPEGISVAIELEKLIEKIVISPQAPEWFVNVVTTLTKDYGFDFQIDKSNLLEPLIY
jgi:hypothetical protein